MDVTEMTTSMEMTWSRRTKQKSLLKGAAPYSGICMMTEVEMTVVALGVL